MNRDLTELNKLEQYLKEHDIPYERIDKDEGNKYAPELDRHQIRVQSAKPGWDWDVICHYGSYGCEEGLLEGMGTIFGGGEPEGWLTADDVIERIENAQGRKRVNMADIELVIKIPKRCYDYIRKYEHIANSDVSDIKDAIINGTPLPKGHGRLGDLDALREEVSSWGMNDYEPSDFTDAIDQVDAIIKADMRGKNERANTIL